LGLFLQQYYDSLTMIGWRWDMILIHECYIEDNLSWKIFVSKAVLSYIVSGSDDQENNKIESSNNESLVARNK